MDKSDVLRQMIAEKQRQIELYQAMIAEWERELGGSVSAPATSGGGKESANGGNSLSVVKEYEFHNKSQTEAAKIVLERVGYPQSTQQLVDAITRGGVTVGGKTPQTQKTNLYTILHRSKKDFGLAAKDRWGLRGWKGIPKSDSKEENGDDKEIKETDTKKEKANE